MRRRVMMFVMVLMLLLPLTALTASADAGLKQTLYVKVEGATSDCYLSVLTAEEEWYPVISPETEEERRSYFEDTFIDEYWANRWDAGNEISYEQAAAAFKKSDEYQKVDQLYGKFSGYRDPDGYHFLGHVKIIDPGESVEIYSPPSDYKLLLYFPDSDTISSTEKLTLPNLLTKTTVKVENDAVVTAYYSAARLTGSPDMMLFFISLFITVVVEILIALCFLFTKGKQILVVLLTNVASLILLNIMLSIINPPVYGSLFSFPYALFEIGVVIAEAAVYLYFFPKFSKGKPTPKWRIITYAVVANLATYAIAAFIPDYYPISLLLYALI